MQLQYLLIFILFAGALFYLGRLFYNSFFSEKKSCGSCSGCSAVDVDKIERELLKKKEISPGK